MALWSTETKKKERNQTIYSKNEKKIVKTKFEAHCVAKKQIVNYFIQRQNSFCVSEVNGGRIQNKMENFQSLEFDVLN